MTQITLVLPFALPPPELAPDLVRALKAPALASLITRASATPSTAGSVDGENRGWALPHETWLARELGLIDAGRPAFAAQAMRGFGLDASDGTWFIVNPAHIEIARSHMLMADVRSLGLTEAHSRALFDLAKPYFDDSGKPLLYGDAHTWFMRADDWDGLDTATPDAAAGMNLTDWLPQGDKSKEYRKLQNEVQMLWYQHPANNAREAAGQQAINGFWPWGRATSGDMIAAAAPALATCAVPGWLAALAATKNAAIPELLASGEKHALLFDDSASRAAIGAEWAAWLAQMQHLEASVLEPLLAALRDGRVARLRLVLSHRDRCAEFTTTKLAQHMFWRQPTLARLLP
ncbi:hypothetical protein [Massilia cavernae]|uniref:Phosphoglycerate mutase n=1 Tax=Massilia cavernae TaxID=2320864 RepID=A0A418Y4T9_9BURK|nr:hypothetical protein [Massilia cavernae]RJG21084.1 hypothetical protein D3872_07405 [Massilia cavernae]